MSRFDDLLTRELERAARSPAVNETEPFGIIARRAARRRVVHRSTTAALTILVIAGSVGAFLALDRVFGDRAVAPAGTPVSERNGLIAYSDINTRSGDGDIFVMNAYGSDVTVLHQPGDDYQPEWSPDGSQIYFDKVGQGLYVMSADGGNVQQLSDVDSSWFALSPDGSMIAYDGWVPAMSTPSPDIYAMNGDKPVQPAIWLMNADGTDPRLLISPPPGEGAEHATWSPNGSQLAFSQAGAIWVVNADGSNPHEIVAQGQSPVWSSDGTQIVFLADGIHALDAVSPDGSNLVTLADQKGLEYSDVAFSPDGTRVLFTAAPDVTGLENYEIYSMNRSGGDAQQLTHVGGDNYGWCCLGPSWQSSPATATGSTP